MGQNKYLSPEDITKVIELAQDARIPAIRYFEVATVSFQKADCTWGVNLKYDKQNHSLSLGWYTYNAGDIKELAVISPVIINHLCEKFNRRCAEYWEEYKQYQITDLLENQ